MSRLTDLIAQAKSKDPQLGADLDKEFKVLSTRLPFGLNFERHRPEAKKNGVMFTYKVAVDSRKGNGKLSHCRLA